MKFLGLLVCVALCIYSGWVMDEDKIKSFISGLLGFIGWNILLII